MFRPGRILPYFNLLGKISYYDICFPQISVILLGEHQDQ